MRSAFRVDMIASLVESTSSIVVRSEHLFHGKEHYRFTLRNHLYESLSSAGGLAGSDHLCDEIHPDDRMGEYLGFLDLRQYFEKHAIAMALLAVPRYLRKIPGMVVVAGLYGPVFGAPSFVGTAFSMQDNNTTGSVCSQACLIMLLGSLCDRGARMEGSYALTYWGNDRVDRRVVVDEPNFDRPPALKSAYLENEGKPVSSFPIKPGLNPLQMMAALNQCNVRPQYLEFNLNLTIRCGEAFRPIFDIAIGTDPESDNRRNRAVAQFLALRCIQAYVRARYPAIAFVDTSRWSEFQKPKGGHAVTLVGAIVDDRSDESVQFVVHDPARQPYFRRSARFLFEAAWDLTHDEGNPQRAIPPAIRLVVATEIGILRNPLDCLARLNSIPDERDEILSFVGNRGQTEPQRQTNLTFELLSRHELPNFLCRGPIRRSTDQDAFLGWLNLQSDRYWCVAGHTGGRLQSVWLFPAESRPFAGYEVKISVTGNPETLRFVKVPAVHLPFPVPE
jgi:hypothetical protein